MDRAGFALLITLALTSFVAAEELKVQPVANGSITKGNTGELKALCPSNGVIANAKDLEKLCKAWMIDVPKVDFSKPAAK